MKKKTAFITNSGMMRARRTVYNTLSNPRVKEKLIRELRQADFSKGQLSSQGVKIAMRVVKDEMITRARGKIMNALHSDVTNLPRTMISGDGSGLSTMVSSFNAENRSNMPGEMTAIKKYTYTSYLGMRASGRIAENPYGFSATTKCITDSEKDLNRVQDKLALVTESGFNQSFVDVLCQDSFFTVGDIKALSRCEKELQDWRIDNEIKITKMMRGKSGYQSDIMNRIGEEDLGSQKNKRLKSKILKLNTVLKVSNDSPAFIVNLNISLCVNKDMIEKYDERQIRTVDSNYLYEGIILDSHDETKHGVKERKIYTTDKEIITEDNIERFLSKDSLSKKRMKDLQILVEEIEKSKESKKSIKQDDKIDALYTREELISKLGVRIKTMEKSKDLKFKRSMNLEPGTKVLNSETVRDHVVILKQYKLQLKPSEIGIIDVKEYLTDGVDLFTLGRRKDNMAPISTFFIIEGVGADNARVTDTKLPQVKWNGRAPCQIRYETKKYIKFISKDTEPGYPKSVLIEGDDFNFEEEELADIFYPKRTNTLSIPIKNLRIGERNKSARYVLDYDVSSMNNPTGVDQMSALTNGEFIEVEDLPIMKTLIREGTRSLIQNMTESEQDQYDDGDIIDMDRMGADSV